MFVATLPSMAISASPNASGRGSSIATEPSAALAAGHLIGATAIERVAGVTAGLSRRQAASSAFCSAPGAARARIARP